MRVTEMGEGEGCPVIGQIFALRPRLGPLPLMLADTPLPRGLGAALAGVDTLSKGSRTVRCLPALPCRLRAMGRTV